MAADNASAFAKLLKDLADQHSEDIADAVRRVKADLGQPVSQNDRAETESKNYNHEDLSLKSLSKDENHLLETQESNDLPGSVPPANAWTEHAPPMTTTKETEPEPTSPGSKHHSSLQIAREMAADGMDDLAEKRRRTQIEEAEKERGRTKDAVSRFVQSPQFNWISAGLLLANAAFIGVQVEFGFSDQVPVEVEAVDMVFCVCFLVELGFRLWGYGCHRYWCDSEDWAWNTFDFVIVTTSTFDTMASAVSKADSALGNISALRVIRVVRIVRVLRIIRVMKFFADLRILLAAIVSTVKTASFAFVLIMFIIYMFAIAISQLVSEFVKESKATNGQIEHETDLLFFFGGIFPSIFALFMTIAGGIDWKDAAVPLFEVGELAIMFFLLYTALMTFCVMNVLLGIFCQCALDTAAADKDNIIQFQLSEKHRFVETLEELFAGWDDNGNGTCSLQEFQSHLQDETTQALLRSLEIEGRDAVTLFQMLDTDDSGEVDLTEFVTGCITLRGGAKAVHMEKITTMNKQFEQKLEMLDEKLEGLNGLKHKLELLA